MLTYTRLATITLLALSLLPTTGFTAEQPMTVPINRLTLETALKIAQNAMTQCRKEGVQVAVTIVDRGGHPQVVLRDTLAMDITLPVSHQKAHTAMVFNSPLSELEGRFNLPYQVPKMDGIMISAGGIPISIGGSILGGIGVSGAPSGNIDEKCARAGLEAVRTDLEMDSM